MRREAARYMAMTCTSFKRATSVLSDLLRKVQDYLLCHMCKPQESVKMIAKAAEPPLAGRYRELSKSTVASFSIDVDRITRKNLLTGLSHDGRRGD